MPIPASTIVVPATMPVSSEIWAFQPSTGSDRSNSSE